MSTGWGLAPLTRADVEVLCQPAMEGALDALDECLLLLHELFARCTGVRFNTQFLDEEEVLRSLHEAMVPLRDVHPFWPKLAQDVDAYWRLRGRVEREGSTPFLRGAAQLAADELTEQWSLLTTYPCLERVTRALVQADLRPAAARR